MRGYIDVDPPTPPDEAEVEPYINAWSEALRACVGHLPAVLFDRPAHYYGDRDSAQAILMDIFSRCRKTFIGSQYGIDALAMMTPLMAHTQRAAEGWPHPVWGRLLMDKGYFEQRNASRQLPLVEAMLEADVEVRAYTPGGSGWAILHTKSWIIDDAIFVTGSLNTTTNNSNDIEVTASKMGSSCYLR